jgi:hypothetical protein
MRFTIVRSGGKSAAWRIQAALRVVKHQQQSCVDRRVDVRWASQALMFARLTVPSQNTSVRTVLAIGEANTHARHAIPE